MAINVAQIVKDRFRPAVKAAGSRYFLVKVDKVTVNPKNPDEFQVQGERLDTGERAVVISKKSSSGQKLPVAGEVMRADKAMPFQTSNPNVSAYRSEYFYSYGADHEGAGFCLAAVALPTIPKLNEENGMWSAQVLAVDPVAASDITADGFIDGRIDAEIAKLLRPWESDSVNNVTHDVMGRSLWGEGVEAVQGVTPFVTVRFEGESVRVFGAGAVKSEQSTEKNKVYRLPTYDETIANIGRNKMLNTLKSAFEGLPADALKDYGVAIIPGVALQVGRESLSGSNQKYLKVPSQFQWKNDKKLDDNGEPTVMAGFRDANIHIKSSRSGRMIVVDTVPAVNGTFSRGLPLSPAELERKAIKDGAKQDQGAAPASQGQSSAPAPAQQSKPAAAAPKAKTAPVQQTKAAAPLPVEESQPAEDQFPPMDDFNEYAQFADDLASINEVSDDFFGSSNDMPDLGGDTDVPLEMADDYLEAQMAAAKKRSGPRM